MSVKTLTKRFYDPHYLIKGQWKGNRISAKEAYTRLYRIAWASTLETLLISMISFIDTVMVSTLGHEAVAAVGLTTQPRNIFFAVFSALNVGVTAVVSRRRGEENREAANKTMSLAVFLSSILGVILFVVSYYLSEGFLLFMGAQDDTIHLAVPYFRIIMLGTVFTSVGLMINAAHRGCGNTKISMVTNLTANLVNIVFNYLLINGVWFFPKLGVTGAAIATLIGNILSFIMSVYSVTVRPGYLHLQLSHIFKLSKDILSPITKVSSGAAVEQLFVRIGFFVYAKLVATLGTESMATHQICMSIKPFVQPRDGLRLRILPCWQDPRPKAQRHFVGLRQRLKGRLCFGHGAFFDFYFRKIRHVAFRFESIISLGANTIIVSFIAPRRFRRLSLRAPKARSKVYCVFPSHRNNKTANYLYPLLHCWNGSYRSMAQSSIDQLIRLPLWVCFSSGK